MWLVSSAVVLVIAGGGLVIPAETMAGAATASASFSGTCPGAACPYTPPTATEAGFAGDVLARMNIERAQPERDYPLNGTSTALAPLSVDPVLSEQAQAFAEYLASTGVLAGYTGSPPPGELAAGENEGGPAGDSSGVDASVMASYGHAVAVLSAAPDFVGIGVAFDAAGRTWWVEEFGNGNLPAWQAGQARLQAELASNSVYAQSGGTVTTVTEPPNAGGGTDNARDVFPIQPIAAATTFATGVDWTSTGPRYPAGSAPTSPLPAPVTGIASSGDGGGYQLVNSSGAISVHGDAPFYGAANGLSLNASVIRIEETPDGGGYWLLGSDGGVFNYGDARFFGSTGGMALNQPVVGMAAAGGGSGYWLVAKDGGVFAFGAAPYVGSLPGLGVSVSNIVGIVPTPDGGGYWLVGSDGGVFAFGDAGFIGSLPGIGVRVSNIVGLVPTADGGGYWLVGADGGVFAFGDAGFRNSLPGLGVSVSNIVGIAAPPSGAGYWLAGSNGAVYALGVAFYGAD
jgi:uncharacterized protein YkwD